MRAITLIVLHCTASPNGRPVSRQEVVRWHQARGFRTIGYHYLIGLDGTVEPGRPESVIGAHAKGFNANALGVCLVGGVGGEDRQNPGCYTEAQWSALKHLVMELMDRHPTAAVVGHRDLSPDLDGDGEVEPHEWIKLCPAFDVAAWLADFMTPPASQVLGAPNA